MSDDDHRSGVPARFPARRVRRSGSLNCRVGASFVTVITAALLITACRGSNEGTAVVLTSTSGTSQPGTVPDADSVTIEPRPV